MLRKILAATLLMVPLGCASVQPVAPQQVRVDSRHVFEKNYSLGVEGSAFVGEPIVRVKDYYVVVREAEALQASESFTLNSGMLHASVPSGTIGVLRGTTVKSGKTYRVVEIQAPKLIGEGFLLNDDGSLQGSGIALVSHFADPASYRPEPATVRFVGTTVTKVDTSKGWKNFELVYSGVTKDSITVLYREYTPEDMARAAYSQNLVYPKESTTIRYRDIAIAVIEASNERLRYVVKADGLK